MPPVRSLTPIALAALVAAGCASQPPRRSGADAQPPPPRTLSDEERELAEHFLPGCYLHTSGTPEELVFSCPEHAVYFGLRDLSGEVRPDELFSGWLDEQRERAGTEVEVLERSESKVFGPQAVTLYLKLRTPDMPPEGFVEAYVSRVETRGRYQRVWCTASGGAPSGLARCRSDLLSVPIITSR